MTKKYQMKKSERGIGAQFVVPETVSVAMAEIAQDMREGLLAVAVRTGLQVMQVLMETDVAAKCGPKGKHDANRTAVRHGSEKGSVALGVAKCRYAGRGCVAPTEQAELAIPTYELFASTEIMGTMALERMLAGLSTRRYRVGLEPVGEKISEKAFGTSRSAVSRKFVAMTKTALADLLAADLSQLDLVALMIDGVGFAESCCVVAMGIDIEGNKHPLALVQGSTENATLVTDLLVDLRQRGLDVTCPMLVGIDGSKALRRAVLDVLDRPVIQRCQIHKIRNVKDHLPKPSSQRRRSQDDQRLPRRLGAGSRSCAAGAGQRTRPHPPRGGGQSARRPARNPHGVAPGRAAHTGSHTALDKRDRIDDLDMP